MWSKRKTELSEKDMRRRIILCIGYVFTLICFYHVDTSDNVRQGINLWEAIFTGSFFEFYSINLASQQSNQMVSFANYDMFMNLILGLAQLPLFILEKVIGNNIQCYFWARVYAKLVLLIPTWIAGTGMKKIAVQIGLDGEKAENVFFMFMSSAIMISSVCMVGQVDIVSLAFAIYALYFLLKGEEWKFVLLFVLSVQCKNFSFFLFAPILLLKEKHVVKVAGKLLLPLVTMYLINLPFSVIDSIGVAAKRPRLWFMIDCMTRVRLSFLGVDIPVLIIAFVFVCIYAYLLPTPSKEDSVKWYLYMGLCGILPILICQLSFPQWMVYILPMTTLLFFINDNTENIMRRLLLECAGTLSLLVGYLVRHQHAYNFDNMYGMLIDKLIPLRGRTLYGLQEFNLKYTDEKYYQIWTASYAVFLVWIVVFLINNYPNKKMVIQKTEANKEIRGLLWLRAVGGFVLCNISIILYCFQLLMTP